MTISIGIWGKAGINMHSVCPQQLMAFTCKVGGIMTMEKPVGLQKFRKEPGL